MIAAYLHNDSIILLDATDKFIDFGIPPYYIQDKEVLVGLDSSNHLIYRTPIMPADYSMISDSVILKLDGNSITGTATREHKGYNKLELDYALDEVNEDDYEKKFSRLFNKGNNKFKVESCAVSDLFEHDSVTRVEYDFTLFDYCRLIGDDIYVNMNLDKKYKEMKIDTSSIHAPIENDFYCIERTINTLQIPDGYQLDYLPEGGSFEWDGFGFDISYRENGNSITMEKVIRFEFLVLLEDRFEDWNEMIKQLNRQYRSSLVLKKIK